MGKQRGASYTERTEEQGRRRMGAAATRRTVLASPFTTGLVVFLSLCTVAATYIPPLRKEAADIVSLSAISLSIVIIIIMVDASRGRRLLTSICPFRVTLLFMLDLFLEGYLSSVFPCFLSLIKFHVAFIRGAK